MSGADRAAQHAWVQRVLGVSPSEAGSGIVNYAKLLLDWRSAQQRAADNLSSLGTAILALEEVQDDPRFAGVASAVKTLPGLVPTFGEELADHLDGAMSAGQTEAGKAHLRAAIKTIASYRQQLAGVPALAALANLAKRSVGFELAAHAELDTALANIEREVSARLA
jgi:hypothetical protein